MTSLTDRDREYLEAVHNWPGATTAHVATVLGVSNAAARDKLNRLVRADRVQSHAVDRLGRKAWFPDLETPEKLPVANGEPWPIRVAEFVAALASDEVLNWRTGPRSVEAATGLCPGTQKEYANWLRDESTDSVLVWDDDREKREPYEVVGWEVGRDWMKWEVQEPLESIGESLCDPGRWAGSAYILPWRAVDRDDATPLPFQRPMWPDGRIAYKPDWRIRLGGD